MILILGRKLTVTTREKITEQNQETSVEITMGKHPQNHLMIFKLYLNHNQNNAMNT